MSHVRSLGLQWQLAAVMILTGLLQLLMVASGYLLGANAGLQPAAALGAGLGAGTAVGLAGTILVFRITRTVKLRLREAGRMAGRIARGNFRVRIDAGPADDVGWLEEQLNLMAGHLEAAVGELRDLAEQNRRLGEEAGRGSALEERARMARELHDTVNQQLFVLVMRIAAARRRVEQIGGEAASLVSELDALEELACQAHTQTRELILQLRPVTLGQQGLGAALHEYLNRTASSEEWEVEEDIDLSISLQVSAEQNLFRIAQEALNNVSKHASARKVGVKLVKGEAGVILTVKDDGAGFDRKDGIRPTAVGLPGIQERVEALGGKLSITSSPGKGTEITVTAPTAKVN